MKKLILKVRSTILPGRAATAATENNNAFFCTYCPPVSNGQKDPKESAVLSLVI